jgi:hypothetical protein
LRQRADLSDDRCERRYGGEPPIDGEVSLVGMDVAVHGACSLPGGRLVGIDLGDAECATQRLQFSAMYLREPRQKRLAGGFKVDMNLSPVNLAGLSSHEIQRLASRDECNHAVMLRLQSLREFADSRPLAIRVALDVQ